MKVEIFLDSTRVAQEAASIIAADARLAVAERGRFIMAVSGGKTPWMMLRALAKEDIPWKQVHVFQVDERIAPKGDPDRNLTHLQETLLSHAPLPPEQIYAMPVEEADSIIAAKKYTQLLESIAGSPPILDLVHLGLGSDGHTASLIPGDPVLKVNDTDVAITEVYQGRNRMTLTYPVINRARRILWVVTGSDKIKALTKLLNTDLSIPGGLIQQDHAIILSDCEIANDFETERIDSKFLKIGLAADHGGFELKQDLIHRLRSTGYETVDFGAPTLSLGDDYPDYVIPLAKAVAEGCIDRGIAICGSGVGADICANKIPGVRAALIHDHFSAKQGTEDDHMNIMCLGGRTTGIEVAWDFVSTYLYSQYSQEERHLRRLKKVAMIETAEYTMPPT
ncbi:MAG: 6-phosphogluconolactonase [Chthoniobacterales bacterium]